MDVHDDDIEQLNRRIERVIAERQALRSEGAGELRLEQNRLRLVALQRALGRSLLERYAPAVAA